jgi:hypothetical protein
MYALGAIIRCGTDPAELVATFATCNVISVYSISSLRIEELTCHVIATLILLDGCTARRIRALFHLVNGLLAQLLLLDLGKLERTHALIVSLARLAAVERDIVICAMPMSALSASEDMARTWRVDLTMRTARCNAIPETW